MKKMESVTQRQQPQQDAQVSRKRRSSTEQGDNGCLEKSKKLNEKNGTTQVDLKDGANMSIQVQQVTTQTQEDPPCCLQSLLRSQRQARRGEPDGNLLKAGSERTPKTINVEFTGTRTDDPATEFHKEMCPDKKAYVLWHSELDDKYYLKVKKSGGVNLRKLVKFPTDDKYFFLIEPSSGSKHVTIQSLKTKGWYLDCSDLGEVSMKEVTTGDNGAPEDVLTWFRFIPVEDVVQYTKTRTTIRLTVDVKDSGKDHPANAVEENSEGVQKEKENAEHPEVGNSEDPGEDNCNDPESGKSQGAAKGSPED